MKTKQFMLSGMVLMIAGAIAFTSCRKPKEKDDDTSGAEDNALADKSYEDMQQISNEGADGNMSSFREASYEGLLSGCATVTRDTAAKTITVDFGPANCLCMDGRYRRGKIFVSYSAGFHHKGYWDSLTTITITTTKAGDPSSDSYYVNDNHVVGTRSVTNNGHNAAHHMNWSITVNGQITKANGGGTISWQSTRNREWLAGEGTPMWADDVYGITGSASGTSAKGVSFTEQVTSQLIRKIMCAKHFVSGTLDFTPGTKPVRHLDFGYSPSPNPPGSCDSWVSVTINGNTYYRQLP